MDKVVIETARTENGYSGACELLPGWIVATTGDFDNFKKEVVDSIRFYVDCAKKDGDEYPAVFDGEYELVYKFDVQSLLLYYQGIFSFSALQNYYWDKPKAACTLCSRQKQATPSTG